MRILVPFPPGGGTDIQARLLSVAFQKDMGQNFIVDNRTGASGLIDIIFAWARSERRNDA